MDLAKVNYDRKVVACKFSVRDLVLIRDKKTVIGRNKKLCYKYMGPYRVVGISQEMHYQVVNEQAKRPRVEMVHQNRLKRYHGPSIRHLANAATSKTKEKSTQTMKKRGRPRKPRIRDDSDSEDGGEEPAVPVPAAPRAPRTKRTTRLPPKLTRAKKQPRPTAKQPTRRSTRLQAKLPTGP